MKNFSYNKNERLKGYHEIRNVFSEGKSFVFPPVKLFYYVRKATDETFLKCSIGASKKNFKKAVHRNRIKRLLKESYRLNKTTLPEMVKENGLQLSVFILFIDKTLPAFSSLNAVMPAAIEKLIKKVSDQVSADM